jgi:hypothetical protein
MVEAINNTEQNNEEKSSIPVAAVLESPSKNDRLRKRLEEA